MYDVASQARCNLSSAGLQFQPGGTLTDRAISRLARESIDSMTLARDILGMASVSPVIAHRLAAALLGSDPRVARLADGTWSLVAPAGPARLTDCVFAVVDVETTGSRPANGDRITEIAIVIVKGGSCEPVYETVVNPERSIPREVTVLTGITQADVASRPRFDEIAEQVRRELTGRIFAAHNVSFDWRFVASEMRRGLSFDVAGPRVCTARLGRVLVSGLRSSSLDSLARYFGIEIQARHRAGGDALATAKLLVRLLQLAVERGAKTVDDLVRLTRRPRKRNKSALPTPMKEV